MTRKLTTSQLVAEALAGRDMALVHTALEQPDLGNHYRRQLRLHLWGLRGVLTPYYCYAPGDAQGRRYVFGVNGGGERSLSGKLLDAFLDGLAAGWYVRPHAQAGLGG